MGNQNPLTKLTLLFAVLLTFSAARAQADILPDVTISFAPVGLTMDQTARLNFVNNDVPNGMFINWRFIDASGLTLAQSTIMLPLVKIVSVDFRRPGGPLPPNAPDMIRARCEPKSRSLALESRAKASVEVWRYSTIIPAQPPCT